MKILNTRQFNEKLDIHPIDKNVLQRISTKYATSKDMRNNFETGDIVISEMVNYNGVSSGSDIKSVYVSFDDLIDKQFGKLLGLNNLNYYSDNIRDGVFVSSKTYASGFVYEYCSSYNDELISDYHIGKSKIICVYRNPFINHGKFDEEYYKYPNTKNAKIIWER